MRGEIYNFSLVSKIPTTMSLKVKFVVQVCLFCGLTSHSTILFSNVGTEQPFPWYQALILGV